MAYLLYYYSNTTALIRQTTIQDVLIYVPYTKRKRPSQVDGLFHLWVYERKQMD